MFLRFVTLLVPKLLTTVLYIPILLQHLRLFAIITAKNMVGNSDHKTMSREWISLSDEEKLEVRSKAFKLLFQDPSDKVALQTSLLIANIGRVDVPSPWSSLLSDLCDAAEVASPVSMHLKVRALFTLKHVLKALKDKVFMIEAGTMTDMRAVEAWRHSVDQQKDELLRLEHALLHPVRRQWEQNLQALLIRAPNWEERGELAAAGLATVRELLMLIRVWGESADQLHIFLSEGAQAAEAIAKSHFASTIVGGEVDKHKTLLSKCWERLLQCAIVAMDKFPIIFARHMPAWIPLTINTALFEMDAASVHHIRPKSRVLLTRFVARALLQPLYRPEYVQRRAALDGGILSEEHMHLQHAADCLDSMLSDAENRCPNLVQAIISKYIVLAPEELAEWELDPESFARQVDLETSPEAETPRPCGVALLECMLQRASETVADAIVHLAAKLQQEQWNAETLLLREATYRAVGECFSHLRPKVDFNAWYKNELKDIMSSAITMGLHQSILKSRAIWLVGVCGDELHSEAWAEAFTLAVQHMKATDIVVALMAVSAVTALIGTVIEETTLLVSQTDDRKELIVEGSDIVQSEELNTSNAMRAELTAHKAAIEYNLDSIVSSCFELLPRLTEIESMVRALSCVSVTVDIMGTTMQSHLGIITTALPQVWNVINNRSGNSPGALTRLQCALIGVMTHLIARLGAAALNEENVSRILMPLLLHSTNISSTESEPLIDDGLQLWLAVLYSIEALPPQLIELLMSRMPAILQRGQDDALAYGIAEGYVLHNGLDVLSPFLSVLTSHLVDSIRKVTVAVQPPAPEIPTHMLGVIPPQIAKEAIAALSFLDTAYQVAQSLPAPLQPALEASIEVVAHDYGGGILQVPMRGFAVLESCLKVVVRAVFQQPSGFSLVCGGNAEAQNVLLDRLILITSSRNMAEFFDASAAVFGRYTRHAAAVSLCALVVADGAAGMRELPRLAQFFALCFKVINEREKFEEDICQLNESMDSGTIMDPLKTDRLWALRLSLAQRDPLRAVEISKAIKGAIGQAVAWFGRDQLIEAIESTVGRVVRDHIEDILNGREPSPLMQR